MDSFFVRFRFVSDSVPDSMAGWFIDSIRVKIHPGGIGAVSDVSAYNQLAVSPNPSFSGIFTFPVLQQQEQLTITVTDVLGRVVLSKHYTQHVDLSNQPVGMYFYYVTDVRHYYTGKLMHAK
jgi:hypothetical protein